MLIDAPVPGVGPWEEILKNPLLWHFRFGGPDMERLVAGRERIYLDRFWNEFSADPEPLQRSVARALRRALRPARRDAFRLRAVPAFDQDAIDNQALPRAKGKLTMPVLAIGGEKSFGPTMAASCAPPPTTSPRASSPTSGHWIMEENPDRDHRPWSGTFLDQKQ